MPNDSIPSQGKAGGHATFDLGNNIFANPLTEFKVDWEQTVCAALAPPNASADFCNQG